MKDSRENEYLITEEGKITTVIKTPIIPEQAYRQDNIEDIIFTSAVKEIGGKAFYKCLGIQNIEFNKGLRVIGDYAFFLCENLTNVSLPSSLTYIGKSAFYNCRLKEMEIGGKVKEIGEEAFAENHLLSKVIINKGVEKIGRWAFMGCHNLEEIYLPSTIKKIGSGAFENTYLKEIRLPSLIELEHDLFKNSKLERISIPESVIEIGNCAFAETPLVSIEFPFNLRRIGDNAFQKCLKIEEIDIPESVTTMGKGAFSDCKNLSYIKLPVSLKEIPSNLFQNCTNLDSINLTHNIRKIGDNAFEKTALRELIVPSRVIEIGKDAFSGCDYLERVILPDGIETLDDYAFSGCESLQGITLPDSIRKLGKGVFKGCNEIQFITLPKELAIVSNSAFSFCEDLQEAILPEKLVKIDKNAFCGCSKLEELSLPSNLKFIDNNSFESCESLRKVTIPDSVEFIGEETFKDCKRLEKIELPKGLVGISRETYSGCIKLKDIALPKSLKLIGFEAFKNTGLEHIELSDNITHIDAGAFEECCRLVDIKLPKHIKTINEFTFKGCLSLENIEIPKEVNIINDEAFMHCMSLPNVDFPKDLVYIGKKAFLGCEKLKEAILPEGVEVISEEAFKGCSKLEKIEIPKSVEYIGSDAFYGCSSLKELTIHNGLVDEALFNIGSSVEVVKLGQNCRCKAKKVYPFEFMTKVGEYFYLTKDPINESSESIVDINEKLSLGVLMSCWDKRETLFRELRSKNSENIVALYNYLYNELSYRGNDNELFKEFFNSKQLKFFNQLCQDYEKFNSEAFYKLFYNLGGFKKPYIEKRINSSQKEISKLVDYGQIVSELFKDVLLKNDFFRENIVAICSNMAFEGFKSDFTRFISNRKNLVDMMTEEKYKYGFFSNCYNMFEEIQRTNTSNKGRQRMLQPTVQKFKEYFRDVKYKGITEETEKLADAIAPYYPSQKTFELAVDIDRERIEKNTPNRILKTHLREKTMLSSIDKYSDKIKKLYADSLKNLVDVAENSFSFDWLDKNDPENYLLGKLTSSCAHLEGAGIGIMKASIIHPDIQNVVIRNKKGLIIAKATLFINREQGYGLINTFEVETGFEGREKLAIYRKFKLAISVFAERYNKENKDHPLKIINVGISMNRLEDEIKANDKQATNILSQINYQDFGNAHDNYNGDSNSGQYTLWEMDEEQDL